MKLGILFSGGKDSVFSTFLAKKEGYEIGCLISVFSENKDSYMFHTPLIEKVVRQSEVMNIPLIIGKTKGKENEELKDLEKVIKNAIKKFKIEGVVTGAVESVYQSSRIQRICDKLKIECFNPLWQKDQLELLEDLIKNKFEVIITGVAAEGFDEKWVGRRIDKEFIKDIKGLKEKYGISISGEGGETESLVVNCPLFKRKLKVVNSKVKGFGSSYRMEADLR